MLVLLGDIHFNSSKDYFVKTSEEFLNWFNNWDLNNKNNILILVGDLVQSHINGGIVIDFLERFIDSSKFDEVHIIVGNHDKRKQDGVDQLAYEFYKNKQNVFIYEEPTIKTLQNEVVLFLPYFRGLNSQGKTMREAYSNLYKEHKKYNLVVGHFYEPTAAFEKTASDVIDNLDKLDTNYICLGHVHTRNIRKDIYIGSVFASKKNENDSNRCSWELNNHILTTTPLPIFNEFLAVSYPDNLPSSKALVPIYTILKCPSESVAKAKYGNIYIRRTTMADNESLFLEDNNFKDQVLSIKNKDSLELFKEFLSIQKSPYTRDIVNKCTKALETYRKTINNTDNIL